MDILNFLGGSGFFAILAFVIIIIYIYNRYKNRR